MSRTKGTYSISANIETNASAPLDARSRVNTLADLTDANSFPYPYVGMETFVVSEGVKYVLTSLPTTNAANWQPADAEELIKVAFGDDIFDGHGTIVSDDDNVPVEIYMTDLIPYSTSDYYDTYQAPGLKHMQSITNCVITLNEGEASSVQLDSTEYIHAPIEDVGFSRAVGLFTQYFTITINDTPIIAAFDIADGVFRIWTEESGLAHQVASAISHISFNTPCVHNRTSSFDYKTVTLENNGMTADVSYITTKLPLSPYYELEINLEVTNDDYYDIDPQAPPLSESDFWTYVSDTYHPMTGEFIRDLAFGDLTFLYWDEDNNQEVQVPAMIWVSENELFLTPQSPISDNSKLYDIFQHAGIKPTYQQPVSPGSIQIGGENGTVITQSDITIGGVSILNQQSGGGGEPDPAVEALVQQFRDADVVISKPSSAQEEISFELVPTTTNCEIRTTPISAWNLATCVLRDERIRANGIYNLHFAYKDPWRTTESVAEVTDGEARNVVYNEDKDSWTGAFNLRIPNVSEYSNMRVNFEIIDGQIFFYYYYTILRSQNSEDFISSVLGMVESIVIGYESVTTGTLVIGDSLISSTLDLRINDKPIIGDTLKKLQGELEHADVQISKAAAINTATVNTETYTEQSAEDWYTQEVPEPVEYGDPRNRNVLTIYDPTIRADAELYTLTITLKSGYTAEYIGSITDGAPSAEELIHYEPLATGLDNTLGPMWVGAGYITNTNNDTSFTIEFSIQNNHCVNFSPLYSDEDPSDVIESVVLGIHEQEGTAKGKLTIGEDVVLTESDIQIKGASIIRPASVSNSGLVTQTSATGIDIYTDPTSYDADGDVPIVLTASQIKAMIDKAIADSGGGGGGRSDIRSFDVPVTVTNTNLVSDSDILPIDN